MENQKIMKNEKPEILEMNAGACIIDPPMAISVLGVAGYATLVGCFVPGYITAGVL